MSWGKGDEAAEDQARRLMGEFTAALRSEVPVDGTALAYAVADLASSVIVSWPAEARERQLEEFFATIARMSAQKLARLQKIGAAGEGAVH
jgi:hypothetical protein